MPQPGEAPAAPRPVRTDDVWQRDIHPTDPLLFRYSALTFNSHRIHYDRRYVTETEGYPGLIVHGPLIATLLIDLLRRNTDRPVATFRFRAVSPLFDIAPFSVHGAPDGKGAALWARNSERAPGDGGGGDVLSLRCRRTSLRGSVVAPVIQEVP